MPEANVQSALYQSELKTVSTQKDSAEVYAPMEFVQKSTNNPVELHSMNESIQAGVSNNFKTGISNAPTTKLLPLAQLRSIIFDIYAQKEKYDAKCAESQLPQETMEQFMYTHLN